MTYLQLLLGFMISNTHPSVLLYTLFTLLLMICSMTAVSAEEKTPLHQVSAETCKGCHEEIYTQWKSSMHANSTALKDPIHGAFYKAVVGNPEQEDLSACFKSLGHQFSSRPSIKFIIAI